MTRCPTCGSYVQVVTGGEGTSYFRPRSAWQAGSHAALAAGLDAYHVRNLLEALKCVRSSGDWHGSLQIACEIVLAAQGEEWSRPNQPAEDLRLTDAEWAS